MTQINLSIFYLESKVDREKSLQLVEEVIAILQPFSHIPYIQNYLDTAYEILKHWGIDIEEYFKNRKE